MISLLRHAQLWHRHTPLSLYYARLNKQKFNNSKARGEQVTSSKPQTIKLGLDVHADSMVVVRMVDHSAPQPAQKFTPAQFREWIRGQQRLAEQVHSCYEAGPFGYGLHRELVELGGHNRVVQPVCLDERHPGVNHDQSDARELALRLDRYVAGTPHALATVRVPTPAEEQKRIASRQREQLKREVLRLAAQGRSLLLTQGYRVQRGWWGARRWAELQGKLPVWLAQRLEVFRRLLTTLTVELDVATTALEAAAPTVRPKGLGGLTYEVIEREVGDWGRFANRRQVASYTGLCGGVSASGNRHHRLPITQHGNVRLRTALVELAWRRVLWQRDCKLVQKGWPVLGCPQATQAARKKAIVAIARQLAVDCWRWRTGRVAPQDLGWVRVGPPA
jgi:transposase